MPRITAASFEAAADPLFDKEPGAERAVALGAASWTATRAEDFATGVELYDREWAFGAPMMRLACLSQVSLRHEHLAAELAEPIRRAAEEVVSDDARRFTKMKWGSDPLDEDVVGHDHAAYLGYAGIALGLARATGDETASRAHDIVVARLRTRMLAARGYWLATYPGEVYPVDMASTVGALALAARLDGVDPLHDDTVALGLDRVTEGINEQTGMLNQSVMPDKGAIDGPRGSGTFLASYFLLAADPDLSRSLYEAGRRELRDSSLGFVAMRERPVSAPGKGDIDSGPILFGYGVSSTGFALAPARAFGDRGTFTGLYATASLFGVPMSTEDGGVRHLAGGPLGDAILCAMATAPTPEELASWARGDRS
ncbi:MAG: hypothetical protein HOV80_15830 [Polyangiaceae bacterium]|nr:hypothetical protein [Polyangiaceae bacterium]